MTEPLFTIPLWADLLGVGLGGIQGAMFASGFQGQRRLDWLGVAIIGVMIGMGGGLIRDLMLGLPPATLQSNWYLITAAGAALLGMLLAGVFNRLNGFIVGLDALVIGMFGAFGTSKAIGLGVPPVPAVFIGVCAAVGGGVLRDVLMGLPVAIMHVGSLYAVAAGVGCTFIVVAHGLGMNITLAAVLCIVLTAIIRVLAVIFDLSLPEQRRLHRRKVATETGMIPIVKP
ncbi:trimeric intracellular cation channel family protein [Microbacterium sp. NPDC057650]|uniref:trimeric intracellular cation channel family protein n=1 Tax=unclassified Microbacterium TaxID=2609290 RepID=UPI00366D3822